MDFYVYLVVFALVLLFVLLLPKVSGIGSFKIDGPLSKQQSSSSTSKSGKDAFKFQLKKDKMEGKNEQNTAFSSARKTGKLEIDPRTGLKKRVIGKYDEDPNNYDYDIDDLVNEDRIEEEKAQAKRLQQFEGSTEKAYEELV